MLIAKLDYLAMGVFMQPDHVGTEIGAVQKPWFIRLQWNISDAVRHLSGCTFAEIVDQAVHMHNAFFLVFHHVAQYNKRLSELLQSAEQSNDRLISLYRCLWASVMAMAL